ncbi:DNA-binding protein [Saccharopolyspora cebuensis]|uniref:DNA-binding protein n=1 Tax=Saccharopolyspora cebuensis TaxID=418759 RepID=A0ABV4CGG1_9PSEU
MPQQQAGPTRANATMTRAELLALPAAIDLVTAGRALGIGRTKAHELARAGQFPVRVLRLGSAYRVPTAEVLDLLGITTPVTSSGAA